MSHGVLVCIPLLSIRQGIFVKRHIRTDAQDGKSSLDAHFVTCSRWVDEHVKEGNNAATPAQLVSALVSNGSLSNTATSLVEYDREQLQKLRSKISSDAERMGALVSRPSDVFCTYRSASTSGDSELRLAISAKLLPHSDQRESAELEVFASVEEAQQEYEFLTGLKVFEESEVRRLQRKWRRKKPETSSLDEKENSSSDLEVW